MVCCCNGSPHRCWCIFHSYNGRFAEAWFHLRFAKQMFIPNLNDAQRREFKLQPEVRINGTCLDTYFVDQPNIHSERQLTFTSQLVDSEAVGSQYYGRKFEFTWTEGGVLCVIINGFHLYCITKLHIHDGTLFCDTLKKLQFLKDTVKEIRRRRAVCRQLAEDIRDENTYIQSCNNCKWLPNRQISILYRVQLFHCDRKEVLEKERNILQKPAKANVKNISVNAETLKVTGLTSDRTEIEKFLVKNETVDIIAQTSGGTEVEDLQVKKGSWEDNAETVIIIEEENFSIEEGTEKFTAKAPSSRVLQDCTGKTETVEVIAKANFFKFRSVEECGKTTVEAMHEADVESYRAECHVIRNEELGSYDDGVSSNELFKEQYFGDGVNIDDQSFLRAICKSAGHKNEDRRSDHSYYQDIHKGRKQQNESRKILELVKMKKQQSLKEKENDARDRIVSTTVSEEWLKKNPDADVDLSFRDPGLSGEKDKIETCFHEDRIWPKLQPSVSDVQQEFTSVTSTDDSVVIVTEEPNDAFSLKCKKRNAQFSDSLSLITERPSDFISLESEKKKKKALWSKLHFTINDNHLSFVSRKNSKKNAEAKIHLKEEVKLLSFRKQVISSSLRGSIETDNTGLNQTKDTNETEIHIPLVMDVALQKEKRGFGINERAGTDIDLQKKKKHHLEQILWFPRNWLPLPRLGRDEIVGFVEEQTRDGHGGSTLPPAEHEALREMLRLLASDNVPGPQITMKYEMLRLCTMKTFPRQDRPFAIRIIGAGFYYAGHQDQVVCYCCGSRKDGWVLGDIPLLIHQNMAPDCGFFTHNALVNVPIRKSNCTESPSFAEVRLLAIQRSDGSDQSDIAQGESSLMLPSSEQNWLHISNAPHQMLVTNKSSPPNHLIASGRQNVLDNLQTVSAHSDFMEEPPPKYPQYTVKNMRINSFQGWPAEHRQRPEEMAECGFYYAGFNDCVRCFHCGVGLRHWMSEDDPWIEHARWSTSCIYVLKMKGEEFVSLVKMAVEIAEREEAARSNSGANQALEHSSESVSAVTGKEASSNSSTVNSTPSKDVTASTGVTGGNATGAAVSTPSSGSTVIQKYLLTDAAQSVLDMGYQPKLVQRAIERILVKKGTDELTGQIILEAVFEIEEETKVQPKPQQSVQSAEGHESIGKANMNSKTNNKQDGQLRAVAKENASSEELQIDPEKIKREHRELREATLCKICMENTISVVFLPCGHLVTCPDCAPAMRKCPICRTLIKGTVKTFCG